MIQVLPSWFLSYKSSWRCDLVVSTDDILILSLLSRYNALINVGDFYLIHLCDSCSFNKNSSANISRSPFIKLIIYTTRFVIIKTFIKKIFASTAMSSHTLTFLCFHKLQSSAAIHCESVTDKESNKEKIASEAEGDVTIAFWISCYIPAIDQTYTAKGHSKNMWAKSSWLESQLTNWVGHLTPLSISRARVGKQPRHIRHIKFLTFGGDLSFQIPDQYPRW